MADEDRRQLHRGLKDLQRQQTECSNRIKGLLASQGLDAAGGRRASARRWRGCGTGPVSRCRRDCSERLLQEFAVWETLHRQVRDAANEQERRLREGQEPYLEKVRRLMGLKAVGVRSAWILVMELFSWRQIKNGKELGALVGLTPTPYDSGKSEREQGISKAGNKHVRSLIVELAWLWLRWQPGSALSQWYERRFGVGEQTGAEGGDRGAGAEAADRAVAVRGAGRVAGRGRGEGLASAREFDGAAAREGGGSRGRCEHGE